MDDSCVRLCSETYTLFRGAAADVSKEHNTIRTPFTSNLTMQSRQMQDGPAQGVLTHGLLGSGSFHLLGFLSAKMQVWESN